MRAFADQLRNYIPRRYNVLGTDGFGRSDYRVKLRQFFEVNRYYVTVAALKALADDGDDRNGDGHRGDHANTGSTRPSRIRGPSDVIDPDRSRAHARCGAIRIQRKRSSALPRHRRSSPLRSNIQNVVRNRWQSPK